MARTRRCTLAIAVIALLACGASAGPLQDLKTLCETVPTVCSEMVSYPVYQGGAMVLEQRSICDVSAAGVKADVTKAIEVCKCVRPVLKAIAKAPEIVDKTQMYPPSKDALTALGSTGVAALTKGVTCLAGLGFASESNRDTVIQGFVATNQADPKFCGDTCKSSYDPPLAWTCTENTVTNACSCSAYHAGTDFTKQWFCPAAATQPYRYAWGGDIDIKAYAALSTAITQCKSGACTALATWFKKYATEAAGRLAGAVSDEMAANGFTSYMQAWEPKYSTLVAKLMALPTPAELTATAAQIATDNGCSNGLASNGCTSQYPHLISGTPPFVNTITQLLTSYTTVYNRLRMQDPALPIATFGTLRTNAAVATDGPALTNRTKAKNWRPAVKSAFAPPGPSTPNALNALSSLLATVPALAEMGKAFTWVSYASNFVAKLPALAAGTDYQLAAFSLPVQAEQGCLQYVASVGTSGELDFCRSLLDQVVTPIRAALGTAKKAVGFGSDEVSTGLYLLLSNFGDMLPPNDGDVAYLQPNIEVAYSEVQAFARWVPLQVPAPLRTTKQVCVGPGTPAYCKDDVPFLKSFDLSAKLPFPHVFRAGTGMLLAMLKHG
ncbi:hypothetical protein HT031_003117 [Scenedesmus sp. PABB004]|nr:hypothetical protein HT031_003117 [Scenedesmus sp. PABB004]